MFNIVYYNRTVLLIACTDAISTLFLQKFTMTRLHLDCTLVKMARGYFWGTEVLFSKSSFGHVNLLTFSNRNNKCSNFIKL